MGLKDIFPVGVQKQISYRGQRRFSYSVVRVHQNTLEVFEREESEVAVSFSKRLDRFLG